MLKLVTDVFEKDLLEVIKSTESLKSPEAVQDNNIFSGLVRFIVASAQHSGAGDQLFLHRDVCNHIHKQKTAS